MRLISIFVMRFILGLLVFGHAQVAVATDWQSSGFPDFSYSLNNVVGDPDNVDTGMKWSGVRFRSPEVRVSLVEVADLINSKASETDNYNVKQNEDGSISSISYTLEDVWDIVSEDPKVISVIPVGYLERGGVPQIAGLIRINGQTRNPLMHAPTLTNLFCLDNELRRKRRGVTEPLSLQWFYTYPVDYDPSKQYQYVDDLSAVILDGEGYSPSLQRADFDACKDLIQSGPRIIEPRRRLGANGLSDRRSIEIRLNDEVLQYKATRTVLAYDLTGGLTVILSHGPAKLEHFADLVESKDFYSKSAFACRSQELKAGGDGPVGSNGKRAARTQACEYWAIALTSFEHSGLIFRTDSREFFRGNTDTTIPGAIILRSKR